MNPSWQARKLTLSSGAAMRSGLPCTRCTIAGTSPGSARRKPRPSSRKASFQCRHPAAGHARPSRWPPTASHGSAIITTSRRRCPPRHRLDEADVVGQHRGEVEAEAVDAEVGEAVERPQHEVLGDRRRDVEVVAAPRRLDVRAVGPQAVERGVVEAPLAVRRPGGLVDLGRVVEHDVEPHLDVVVVGGGDERGQLGGRVVARSRTGGGRRRTPAACSPSSCPPADRSGAPAAARRR